MQPNVVNETSRKALELFQAALEKPRGERDAFLAEACPQDAGLRAEIDKLLAADEGSSDVFGAAVDAEAAAFRSSRTDSSSYRQIGPYRLFRELGEGGMGTVYLAGRVDDEFRQQVTVKLIRRGLDSEGILRRFRSERQILASLHHPRVAQLLDGGTTDDGLPYFVMEYVDGEPIDRYCNHNKLSINARLRLFRKICSAVQYAHQNLVVHRDLKPGNILVTSEGEPKLLDFGVAKLLNPELLAQTVSLTGRDLMRFMTLPYASPEQVQGRQITTASDVYSLGVLLYELLTGHRPYRLEGKSRQEIEREICESEPDKPSTAGQLAATTLAGAATDTAKGGPAPTGKPEPWRRKLSGDLDKIILKAMRKEPQRRYASAAELSDDIQRYLQGLPVIARPSTFGYRAGKFIRRNKLLVGFMALLFAFAVGMTTLWFRVQQERDVALRERATTQQVLSFLIDSFKVADPSEARGETVSAREILDRGSERIDQELGGQPEVRATLMNTIGLVYGGLGSYDRAVELLEEALGTRRQTVGEETPETAESLHNLALVRLAKSDYEQAEPLFRRALELRRELLGEEHVEVAASLHGLAALLLAKGSHQEAEPLFRRALELRRKLLGAAAFEVAESLHSLAIIKRKTGEYAEAEIMFREVLRIYRELKGDLYPASLQVMSNLAGLLVEKGDYEASEPLHRRILELRIKLLGQEHPQVGDSLHNLAAVLRYRGKYEEAISRLGEALKLWRRVLGENHRNVGIGLTNLGELLISIGSLEQAEIEVRNALAILQSALPEDNWWIYRARNTLGACLTGLGRYQEAEDELHASYPILEEETGARSPYTQKALQRLGDLYDAWGKLEQAAEYRALLDAAATPSD